MFSGRYEHTIDGKGRTSLPARFREILSSQYSDDRLIVTSLVEPCLIANPVSEWQTIEQKIRMLPRFDPDVTQVKRVFISGAIECPIDKNGRILIPPSLREFAALEREIVWVGQVNYIEIWSKKNWEKVFKTARDQIDLQGAIRKLEL